MENRVVVKHGTEPAKQAYQAIESVFEDHAEGKKILLKPNLGRVGPAKSGLCTHPEVIRGLINYFQDKGADKIYVGDGALVGVNAWEAFASSGIKQVCKEEGAICINLDEATVKEIPIPNSIVVEKLKLTSFLDKVDFIISVPVIKTHMYTGATLSIKNMKGCLYKKEKTKLHRIFKEVPDKSKGLILDYGIADMASVLYPDYAVIDGIVGMEGFGPSVGTPKALDVVIASQNPLAADLIATQLMGMDLNAIPHLNLVQEKLYMNKSFTINTEPTDFMQYSKKFEPASLEKLNEDYPNIKIVEKGACSACSAATMSFAKKYNDQIPKNLNLVLQSGKDLDWKEFDTNSTIYIGNCTSKTAKRVGAKFCEGCPPVGSSIFEFVTTATGSNI